MLEAGGDGEGVILSVRAWCPDCGNISLPEVDPPGDVETKEASPKLRRMEEYPEGEADVGGVAESRLTIPLSLRRRCDWLFPSFLARERA